MRGEEKKKRAKEGMREGGEEEGRRRPEKMRK